MGAAQQVNRPSRAGALALRPLTRVGMELARRPEARAALASIRALGARTADSRHPLVPAAVRLERSRMRRSSGRADQTALTVWFGTGPSLPAPGDGGFGGRTVVRAAAGVLVAAALGTLAAVAAHREAARLDAARPVPRLEG